MAAKYDFDFQRYVDRKKNPGGGQEDRGGFGDYAFSSDLRVLRQIQRATPVKLVVEATVRFWKSFQKNEMLGTAVKVNRRQFPRLWDIASECAEKLDIPMPTMYVVHRKVVNAGTFGTHDDSYIVLNSLLVEEYDDDELRFVIGHECGHIQNNHVVYHTAATFMARGVGIYVKYASLPASMALDAWSRRGEITCDRAGAICCGDSEASFRAMLKLAVGKQLSERMDLEEFLAQADDIKEGVGRFQELFTSHPYLPKRVKALQLFFESSYYKNLIGEKGGSPLDEVDREVEELIQVL